VTSQPPTAPPAAELAELWQAAQRGVVGGAAHEIKNALNGVAVNLAVVQSRLRREGAPESVSRFADAANAQLELLTVHVEALLALVRPAQGAADVGQLVRDVVALVGRGRDGDGAFAVAAPDPVPAHAGGDPALVRTLVVLALSAALAPPGGGGCDVRPEPRGGFRLALRAAGPVAFDPRLATLAAAAGVGVDRPSDAELVLTFPPAPDPAKL
jgi:hypothetical protein